MYPWLKRYLPERYATLVTALVYALLILLIVQKSGHRTNPFRYLNM